MIPDVLYQCWVMCHASGIHIGISILKLGALFRTRSQFGNHNNRYWYWTVHYQHGHSINTGANIYNIKSHSYMIWSFAMFHGTECNQHSKWSLILQAQLYFQALLIYYLLIFCINIINNWQCFIMVHWLFCYRMTNVFLSLVNSLNWIVSMHCKRLKNLRTLRLHAIFCNVKSKSFCVWLLCDGTDEMWWK